MNRKTLYLRKKFLSEVNHVTLGNNGSCKIYPNNTLKHEVVKFEIVYLLLKQEYEVWTEVRFKNNSRCDILTFNPRSGEGRIIEILESEELEDAKIKTEKYPDIDKIYIKCRDWGFAKEKDIYF